jgi:hypothetical protein
MILLSDRSDADPNREFPGNWSRQGWGTGPMQPRPTGVRGRRSHGGNVTPSPRQCLSRKRDRLAAKDGKVVCFFQSAQKFKTRYATLGFSDKANLDKNAMWPTAFALKELTAADEARMRTLVKQAVS